MSKSRLLSAKFSSLEIPGHSDTKSWSEISKLIGNNNLLVDRGYKISSPFGIRVHANCALPEVPKNFSKTYEQICDERVESLLRLQDKIKKPICILYSGGIDSTVVVVSFLKRLSAPELQERVKLYLNPSSIHENPLFYKDHIRGVFRLESSEKSLSLLDGNNIIVSAEFNDQLFGNYQTQGLILEYGAGASKAPYSREGLYGLLKSFKLSPDALTYWVDNLDSAVRSQTTADVRTMVNFLWWFNFIYKWQSTYFSFILRMPPHEYPKVSDQFLSDHLQHFFQTDDFQRWSICNPDLKIKNTWASYKWTAKDLIYNYNKDAHYRDHKLKAPSLNYIVNQRVTAEALTDDFQFLFQFDPKNFLIP